MIHTDLGLISNYIVDGKPVSKGEKGIAEGTLEFMATNDMLQDVTAPKSPVESLLYLLHVFLGFGPISNVKKLPKSRFIIRKKQCRQVSRFNLQNKRNLFSLIFYSDFE